MYALEDISQGYRDLLDGKNVRGGILHRRSSRAARGGASPGEGAQPRDGTADDEGVHPWVPSKA